MPRGLARPLDIRTLSPTDLLRVVEEVRATKEPRILQRDSEPVALLMPLPARRRARRTNDPEAVLAAVRATAGVWKGLIDGEQFKKDIKEARGSDRPDATL
jgi:antitoxin (DNA-binding transcriptional repressor) of toxin-antitoxin stability system